MTAATKAELLRRYERDLSRLELLTGIRDLQR
jgi:hypothetical protein